MLKNKKGFGAVAILLTAVFMLSFVFTACNSGNTPGKNTGDNPTTSGSESGEPVDTKWIDTLPDDLRYDGYDFCIGWANPFGYNEISFSYEDALGDTINAEIYERNGLVEDRLGITISEYRMGDWDQVATSIEEMNMLSGDAAYTVCCADLWFLFQSSLSGNLLKISDIDNIDINHPWWDTETISEMYSLGTDSYYFISGDINYCDDYALLCLYFNSKLFVDYQLDSPYDKVRNNEWTFDALNQYIKGFPVDNGDNALDENDIYGTVQNMGAMLYLLNGFGEHVLSYENGTVSVNDSKVLIDKVDKIIDFFSLSRAENVIVERKFGYDIGNKIFPNGNSLFTIGMVGSIVSYRFTMDDNFGILPFPKYDENQKNYRSSMSTAYGTAYAVLNIDPDVERTGNILEVMGYYSTNTIRKEIIEKNVIIKATRDNDSAEMLDIIFSNKSFDLGGWGTEIYERGMSMVRSGENTYSSVLAEVKDIIKTQFESTPDFYY